MLDGGCDDNEHVALAATLLYAIYSVTNSARHHQFRFTENEGAQHLWGAIRKAGLQSRRLASLLRHIWIQQ